MQFESVYRRSVVITPNQPETFFIARQANEEGSVETFLGHRALLTLVKLQHLNQFKEGDLTNLDTYVQEDPREDGLIVFRTRGFMDTVVDSPKPRIYFGSGYSVVEAIARSHKHLRKR